MLPRALLLRRQQHTRTAAIVPPRLHSQSLPPVHLQLKRRPLHVYTHGEGFLGCLGHGDYSKQQVCKRVDGVAQVDVRTVSAGWTHSAATCSRGQLVVWGRPYDFKGSMRLNNLNKIVPFFVRAINAFSNPGEVLPHPVIVPVRTSAQIQERPWDGTKPLPAAQSQPQVNTTQRRSHGSFRNDGDRSSPSAPVERTAHASANVARAVPPVKPVENFDISKRESPHDGTGGLAGPKAVSVSCSAALTVVLTERGRVYCMGQNRWGQCGQGKDAPIHVFEPMVVKGIALSKEKVVKVAVGFQHCLVLCESGKVFGWGKGERGQLGTGDDHSEELAVPALLPGKAVSLSSGFNHAVAILENGEVYIWGKMQNPILKTEGTVPIHHDQLLPRKIEFEDEGVRIIEAFCSSFHTVLRADDGRVFMCGMPNDSRVMVHKPVEVDIPASSPGSFLDGFNDTVLRTTTRSGETVLQTLSFSSQGAVVRPLVLPGLELDTNKRIASVSVGWQHKMALVE